MFQSQIELVSTGVCRGRREIPNEDIVNLQETDENGQIKNKRWAKYNTEGKQEGDKKEISAEEIFKRLGVKSRPCITGGQSHWNMFNNALDDAIARAESYGLTDVRGNINALFAASTDNLTKYYNFLERISNRPEISPNAYKEFIRKACSGFNSGVNTLCDFADKNPFFNSYAVVGATEILNNFWRKDNFDRIVFGDLSVVALFKITPIKTSQEKRGVLPGIEKFVEDSEKNIVIREEDGFLYMNGKKVMRIAPDKMIEDCLETLQKYEIPIHAIDKFVFHPGSAHVMSSLTNKMQRLYGSTLTSEHLPCYLEDSGNNGAATTPNTLHREITERKISRNTKLFCGALGMGYHRATFIVQGFPYLPN